MHILPGHLSVWVRMEQTGCAHVLATGTGLQSAVAGDVSPVPWAVTSPQPCRKCAGAPSLLMDHVSV